MMMEDDQFEMDGVGEMMGDSHGDAKSGMLKDQLGIYGKADLTKKKGRGKKKKKGGEPETEPESGRHSSSRGSKSRSKKRETEEEEAEKRRLSRQRKAQLLQQQLAEEEDEEEESLLARLEGQRRSKRRSKTAGPIDDTPMSVTIWVYILFVIVAIERSIKWANTNADPVIMSKFLGSFLILGSFGVKVPQIAALLEAKTAKGLSLAKFYTGVVAATLIVVYHVANKNAFTAWGDSLSVLAQDIILVGLIWHFGKTRVEIQAAFGVAYIAIIAGLVVLAAKVRADQLWPLPIASTLIAHSGTVPQIIENYKNQHTGALSFLTQLLLTLGSLARVFTTLSEMSDPVVLVSFISSVIVQGIVLVQILMYWANTKRVLAKAAKRKSL